MYKVIWWDAYGNPKETELLDKIAAETMCANMIPAQEAQLIFVWVRN